MARSHRSASEDKNCDANGEKNDRGNPPDYFHPGRFWPAGKFAPDEFVVIEIVVRQIEAISGICAPAGIMVRAAFRAGEGTTRDVFAADRADFRGLEPGFLIAVDIPIKAENGDL